jgi:hypothetical protein
MRSPQTVLAAFLVILAACGSQTDGSGQNDGSGQADGSGLAVAWSPTADNYQSGITIAALPPGFTLVTNVGNEVTVAHRFEDADGRQLEVFRLLEPERFPAEGDVLETSNGVTYVQAVGGGRSQVFFESQGVRLGVSSSGLMVEELLAIAKSITYDSEADQLAG